MGRSRRSEGPRMEPHGKARVIALGMFSRKIVVRYEIMKPLIGGIVLPW